jgi:hypothetical protein
MGTKTRKNKTSDYVIAIPSYKRPEIIQSKTLAVLKKYKIPTNKIHIFVANTEEEDSYRKALPKDLYGKIVVAIKGIREVRNFITNYFPVGKKIVCMDDDIKEFIEYDESTKRKEKHLSSLTKIIELGFSTCKKFNLRLWGIYPIANGFFMKPTITTDLKFIVGVCFGYINPGIKDLDIPVNMKTDYYISLRMYELDGGVVRINSVAPKTAYYKESGGIQADPGRQQKSEEATKALLKLFPQYVTINPHRKSGFTEIRIRDSKKKSVDKDDEKKSDV